MWHRGLMVLAVCAAVFALAVSPALAADPKTHTGKVISAGSGSLVMTGADGQGEHTHAIGATCKITLDGNDAKLEDLKKDHKVTVTTEEQDGKQTVTKVEATST